MIKNSINTFLYISTLVLFILLSCLLVYKHYSNSIQIKAEKEKNKKLTEKIIDLTAMLGSFDFPSDMLLLDKDGQKSNMQKLLDGKAKLVFRITDLNSQSSVKSTLSILKTLSKQIGVNNIVLLISSAKTYEAQIFCQNNNLCYPYFKIGKDQLHGQAESLDRPYFFILTPGFKVHSLFVPDEDMDELTIQYFSHVFDFFTMSGQIACGIKFDHTNVDLGEIKQGKKYALDFWYENEMKDPLLVYNVSTSCGCTVAAWDKKPLKTNARTKIKVEYNAEQKGHFTKSIMVSSNANNDLVVLTIKGIVV